MKSIGIMSMHRIFNYGSFLQGYALKQILHSIDPSARVNFLDYRPGKPILQAEEESTHRVSRTIKKVASYGKVNTSLVNKLRFFNHKRTYAQKNFPALGLSPEPNYNFSVDLQIIGSDEVFNCVQANSNVGYSRDLFGHASPAKAVISYAGSFGNTTLQKLKKYGLIEQLREDFLRFADISVRDENSRSIVEEITGRSPAVHVDPVLAYDYMKECKKIPAGRMNTRPYMIVYGYAGRFTKAENAAIRAYAKAKDYEILCIGGVQGCGGKFMDCTPFEVLALFRDAEAVVTDTFHGSIFSIINKKKFITIIRRSHGDEYGNEEKLRYLLDSLFLGERGVYSATQEALGDVLGGDIDYGPVMSRLDSARIESRDYLQRNLNLIGQSNA